MNLDFSQMKVMVEQMQERLRGMQARVAAITVEGSAGAGMVSVKMNGKKQVLEVRIDPEIAKNEPDMLPDLIRAAVNQAGAAVDERVQSEAGGLAGGLPLDGLF